MSINISPNVSHISFQEKLATYPGLSNSLRKEWSQGVMESTGKGGFIVLVIFSLFWNGCYLLPLSLGKFTLEEIIGESKFFLILPLVGLLLICATAYQYLSWKKFGKVSLHFSSLPIYLGQPFEVKLRVESRFNADFGVNITWECELIEETYGENNDDRKTSVWKETQIIPRDDIYHEESITVIPIQFKLSMEAPETDLRNSKSKVKWKILAKAKLEGVDFIDFFYIPVFKETDSSLDNPKHKPTYSSRHNKLYRES